MRLFKRALQLFVAVFAFSATLFASPLSFIEVDPPEPSVPELNDIVYEETVTVRYIEILGGFYGLENERGEKLYPLNLPEVYKQDGTELYIKYKEADTITIYNWGKPIIIETLA